jgi:hypothetical protein
MRRRLFAVASAISLLLCLGTVGLWVRSYFVSDWVSWSWFPGDSYNTLTLGDGTGCLDFQYGHSSGQHDFPHYSRSNPYDLRDSDGSFWGRLGFRWDGGPGVLPEIPLPFLPLALILTAFPIFWSTRRIRHRRLARKNACLTCGYDLRATPNPCPECSTPVPKAPAGRADFIGPPPLRCR